MYSSIGSTSQTMKSSGCGPTSVAMVVSSSKGAILPTTMAQLFVSNGYRTTNNGTAWSAYSFVADYFDFDEYHCTYNFDTMLNYLKQQDNNGNSKYYVVASCGSGLFTTGGHYIVLVADNGGTITVYDPYLYSGKFNTASRKSAGVTVSGNSAYVSESSFKTYANYKCFWIYSNDNGSGTNISQYQAGQRVLVNEKVGVCCYAGDMALVDDGSTQFWIHKSLITSDYRLYGLATICYAEGSNYIVQIFDTQFWTTSMNISDNIPNNETTTPTVKTTTTSGYTTGRYVATSRLNVRSGAGTNYKIKKTYSKGTVFDVTKVSGNWGKTPSGWVCLKYARKK